MFARKPHTILTARIANAKAKNKKNISFYREPDFTSPAEQREGLFYVTIAGLTMPTNH